MLARGQLALGILAGGRGLRLAGADKALVEFNGQPLLSRTRAALGSGFGQVLISYNGADSRAVGEGASIVPDLRPGFHGPLAGLESLLHAAGCEWLLTVPVDLRDIPPDLPDALCCVVNAIETGEAGRRHAVVVSDADGLQPLVALWPVREALTATAIALDAGDYAAHRLVQSMQSRIMDISPWRLGNLNAPSDFE